MRKVLFAQYGLEQPMKGKGNILDPSRSLMGNIGTCLQKANLPSPYLQQSLLSA